MDHNVLVVDGNIASGKTTYIQMLCEELKRTGLRVTVVKEPVDHWESTGLLQTYYSDTERWAYLFQTAAYQGRIAECIRVFEESKDSTDVFILERSCITDSLFMNMLYKNGKVTDLEMLVYREWCTLWYKLMPFSPTNFLYIRTTVPTCMVRRTLRSRKAECDIPKEYFESLEKEHEELFGRGYVDLVTGRVPVTVVDVSRDYKYDSGDKKRLVDQVCNVIGK